LLIVVSLVARPSPFGFGAASARLLVGFGVAGTLLRVEDAVKYVAILLDIYRPRF
jgi:hypothetical protein